MNRHERRAAKKRQSNIQAGDVISIERCQLLERDPNYGIPARCYICDTPHNTFCFARIEDKSGAKNVPLCEPCHQDADAPIAIMWRFHVSALTLIEGGEATHEQVLALAERQRAIAH